MSEPRPLGFPSPFGRRGDQWSDVQASDNYHDHADYSQQRTAAGTPSSASYTTPVSTPAAANLNSTDRTRSERQRTPRRVYSPPSQLSSSRKRKQGQQPNTPSARRKRTPASARRSAGHKSTSKRSRRQDPPSPRTSPGHDHPANYLDKPPPHLFNTKRQHRPEIWKFVKLAAKPEFWHLAPNFLNEHAEFAYCTKCSVKIPFKTSNHQVVPHMERFYPNDLGASRPLERNLNSEFADTIGSIRKITKEEQDQVNALLARWISTHFRPLLMVEDEGFIEFVTYITQTLGRVNVLLPKRTQLRRCIMIFAAELRAYVHRMIGESCDYYSVTADIWTAPNSRSYIAFTVHYVDEDFNPRNWTLEVKDIPGKHTGQLIAEYLDGIMDDWNLDKQKCTRLVRDSGGNMVSTGKYLESNIFPAWRMIFI